MLDSLVRVSRRVLKVPKAIASQTGVYRSLSESTAANSRRGPVPALGPTFGLAAALAAGRTRTGRGPAPLAYRRASRSGTAGPNGTTEAARSGSLAALRPTPNGSRRPTGGEVHAFVGRRRAKGAPGYEYPASLQRRALHHEARMNLPFRPFGFLRFTPERFHVLLNSLFKVLFNFPSRYLFAIGLVVIFSLRWSLPPT